MIASAITPFSAVILTVCTLLIVFAVFWLVNPQPPKNP